MRARGHGNFVGGLRAQDAVALSAACMMVCQGVCLLPSAALCSLPGQDYS